MISVIITLIIIGVVLYAVNTYIPMETTIKGLLNIIIIIFTVLYLFRALGFESNLGIH